MKPEKILVTGAAGFIGSNLCERLLSLGHMVCAVDNLSQSTLRNFKEFLGHPHLEFFQEDVRNVPAHGIIGQRCNDLSAPGCF